MIVPLRSRRRERAIIVQKLQHAAPAVVLFGAGITALGEGPHGGALALAIVEIVSSVLLAGSFVRAIRKARGAASAEHAPHSHHGVDWIDIFTAVVLFAEAWEHYHVTHHVKRPTVVLGLVLLTLGVLHGRLAKRLEHRRTLRVEDEGLYVSGRPFRTLRAKWGEIRSIEVGERWGTITLKDGRSRKLDLPDLEGSTHVRAALAAAQQRLEPL
jgi:hypothetical protein